MLRFNLALEFPQNEDWAPNFVFLEEYFPTKRKCSGSLKFRERGSCPMLYGATAYTWREKTPLCSASQVESRWRRSWRNRVKGACKRASLWSNERTTVYQPIRSALSSPANSRHSNRDRMRKQRDRRRQSEWCCLFVCRPRLVSQCDLSTSPVEWRL